jgi:hypothetical protein
MAPYDAEPLNEYGSAEGRVFSNEPLPVNDPVQFLAKCLERYQDEKISGYTALLRKQERIQGKLQPSEDIEVSFREAPYSVLMRWLKGQKLADSALYVEGKNDGKLLVHPSGLAGRLVKVVSRDPEGEEARRSGRYSMKNFGLKMANEKAYGAWKAAREKGDLHARYLGVRKVFEAGDRPCYTLHRKMSKPDEEGVTDVILYIDKDSWLQVGTVLKNEEGKLVGEYMFRDIHINPQFKPDHFEASALGS